MNRIIFLRSSWCDCRNCINCIDNKTFEIRDGKLGFNLVEELVDRNNLCNFIEDNKLYYLSRLKMNMENYHVLLYVFMKNNDRIACLRMDRNQRSVIFNVDEMGSSYDKKSYPVLGIKRFNKKDPNRIIKHLHSLFFPVEVTLDEVMEIFTID